MPESRRLYNAQEVLVKTRQQLANEFGISYTTLWRKLKSHGLDLPGGLVYPEDQERIYKIISRASDFTPVMKEED